MVEISAISINTVAPFLLFPLLLLIVAKLLKKPDGDQRNLPPGTTGLPFFGETLDFIRVNQSGDQGKFIRDRAEKYGSNAFRTSLLGEPMVVLCGPAANKFLFSNEGKKVALWWPASVRRLIGPSLITKVGDEGRVYKKMMMSFFSMEALMKSVGTMDEVTRRHLAAHWEGKEEIKIYPTVKSYTFELACRLFMDITEPELISKLAFHFNIFLKGVIGLPLNFPGTRFYKAMRAADSIRSELRTLVKQRKAALEKKTGPAGEDLLSYLISNADENGRFLPEEEIINNVLNLLFAGHDTSSCALTLVMKYLAELPQVHQKVRTEQREIAAARGPGELLHREDLQKMKYTWNVVSEVMRMNPPINGSFREALEGFNFDGYTIPKGWKLFWSASFTHKDPKSYETPTEFDELRFEGSGPPPFSYVPFGGGPRMCLGKEFARLEILVFLHNLINRFEWELMNPNERLVIDPMPTPAEGLPVRIRPRFQSYSSSSSSSSLGHGDTHRNLPPGTFGWPIIGESLEFLRLKRGCIPEKFVQDRVEKYGSYVFRTSLLGEPVVVFGGPAGNKFLFSNEGRKVALWWPRSVYKLVCPSLVSKVGDEGRMHKKILTNFLNAEALVKWIDSVSEMARLNLATHWEGREELKAYPLIKLFTFELSCRFLMSTEDPEFISRLSANFIVLHRGLITIPLDFPGTLFNKAKRAADAIKSDLRTLLRQRRTDLEKNIASPTQDMLSHMLSNADENGRFMTETEIVNNLVNLLFAGHDTSSSTLSLLIKYLGEMPHVREKVLSEQTEIAASKGPGDQLLEWEDLKRMKYSWNVVSEVMRLNPPINGSFRVALEDFTFEGYTIPKGWKLYWTADFTHKDPNTHQRATEFDESRFEGSGLPPFSYVPFGGGPRMCLGKEFARLEILIFLHNLVRQFEWEVVIPNEKVISNPLPMPANGLPIRLRSRQH